MQEYVAWIGGRFTVGDDSAERLQGAEEWATVLFRLGNSVLEGCWIGVSFEDRLAKGEVNRVARGEVTGNRFPL